MDYAFYLSILLMFFGYVASVCNDRLDVDTFAHKAIDLLSLGMFIAGFGLSLMLSVLYVVVNKL